MKKIIKLLGVVLILCTMLISCDQDKESQLNTLSQNESKFAKLTGPYLGQKPPGKTPDIFAPGIISTSLEEKRICFSADGNECYYQIIDLSDKFVFYTRAVDNCWTKPEMPLFSIKQTVMYPFLTEEGEKLLFSSLLAEDSESGFYMWSMPKKNSEWAMPQKITFGEKNEYHKGGFVSAAANGNLYFQHSHDVYMSVYVNDSYLNPVRLNDNINGPKFDGHPHISPDESYLIFDAMREDNYGEVDLYISFRDKNGEWIEAINMGEKVNSTSSDFGPFVTLDEKYLFFCSNRMDASTGSRLTDKSLSYQELQDLKNGCGNGSYDFYWVDAKVINDLKPEHLK